jgi:hypothetical protein
MGFDVIIKYKRERDNIVDDTLSKQDEKYEHQEGEFGAIFLPILK